MITTSREELAKLARKYEEMARLRREHARGMPDADRAELRALAKEFPGALSELDTMESAEIDHRATALRAAANGAAIEPWMTWVFAFHAGLREAFAIKQAAGHRLHATAGGRAAASLGIEARSLPIDEAFVADIMARRGGRIVPVVLAAIARWTGDDPEEIARAILPRRRR